MNLKDTETPIPVEQLCDVKAFSLDKVARQKNGKKRVLPKTNVYSP